MVVAILINVSAVSNTPPLALCMTTNGDHIIHLTANNCHAFHILPSYFTPLLLNRPIYFTEEGQEDMCLVNLVPNVQVIISLFKKVLYAVLQRMEDLLCSILKRHPPKFLNLLRIMRLLYGFIGHVINILLESWVDVIKWHFSTLKDSIVCTVGAAAPSWNNQIYKKYVFVWIVIFTPAGGGSNFYGCCQFFL